MDTHLLFVVTVEKQIWKDDQYHQLAVVVCVVSNNEKRNTGGILAVKVRYTGLLTLPCPLFLTGRASVGGCST